RAARGGRTARARQEGRAGEARDRNGGAPLQGHWIVSSRPEVVSLPGGLTLGSSTACRSTVPRMPAGKGSGRFATPPFGTEKFASTTIGRVGSSSSTPNGVGTLPRPKPASSAPSDPGAPPTRKPNWLLPAVGSPPNEPRNGPGELTDVPVP